MSLMGFFVAFFIGWKFALVCLGIFPFLFIGMMVMGTLMKAGIASQIKAYNKGGAYAEQALNAIRIVSAFGQEEAEERNFTRFLESTRKSGHKNSCKSSLGMAIFYGIIFGVLALGMAAPNIKALGEGRVNAASALKIINRVPEIDSDDRFAPAFDADEPGDIVLRNVTFQYPGRQEKALDGLDMVIEHGKTTAIVGPSGSGKSTTVKLLERYYDPTEGDVMVGTQNLRSINLKSFRQKVGYVG